MIPFSGVLLILVGVICGLYARQNSTASFFHKVLLWYGLLAIGFSLFAGYFLLNTYQSLTTFVANNALLVLMLLSSIVRPDNMDEFCRQQLILALRTCGFVAFALLVGLMSWFSENYRYTLIEGIPVVYAWLTAGVEYMNGTKHVAHLALVPVPLPDDDARKRDLSTKPSNIDTKFFDLVMGEYNGFDLHKKRSSRSQ
uniref:Uncharacterized protein n=1 Tax=Ditylenchus dipsaci TaxID=166011 RepID=A0A915DUU8_9BILA